MTLQRTTIAVLAALTLAPVFAAPGDDLDPSRIRMAESATAKGDGFLKNGKYERAESEFVRAIGHEKRYPAAHLGLGAVMVATGRYEDALEALYEAENMFVEWKKLNEIAGLQNRQYFADRERAAKDVARQAAQNNPAVPGGSGPQPGGSVGAGNVAREVAMDRHVADRLQPEEVAGIPAQVFYLEGVALLRLGRRDEGIDALQTSLFVDAEHALSHYNLAVARFTGGELEAAAQHLQSAIDAGAEPHPQLIADLNAALEEAGMDPLDSP